jgi:hypothetical protein
LPVFPISYIVPEHSGKGCSMTDISGTSFTTCQVAADGSAIRLVFEAPGGKPASLTLPIQCVQQLLMTLPHAASEAIRAKHGDDTLRLVFPLGGWKLEQGAGNTELILTLKTPDGFEVAFAVDQGTMAQMSRTAAGSATALSTCSRSYVN